MILYLFLDTFRIPTSISSLYYRRSNRIILYLTIYLHYYASRKTKLINPILNQLLLGLIYYFKYIKYKMHTLNYILLKMKFACFAWIKFSKTINKIYHFLFLHISRVIRIVYSHSM